MAAATVLSPPATRIIPLWLCRFHSWWFASQVLVNLAAAVFIIRLIRDNGSLTEFGLGLLLGQGFLLSLWLALGGLPNVARFIGVSCVTLAGGLAVSDYEKAATNWGNWVFETGEIFIVCLFIVLMFHGLILPLRWLLGWRLDFDPAYHGPERTGRLQVGVTHFLAWTTFLAIPCALFRLLPSEDFTEVGVICLKVAAMTLPLAASCALAALGRPSWLWILAAAGVLAVTWTAELFIPDLVIDSNFLQFNLGIGGAVMANLLVLRCLGLHLFSVVERVPCESDAAKGSAVKPPHFAATPVTAGHAAAATSGS